jgi:hypothetical protein
VGGGAKNFIINGLLVNNFKEKRKDKDKVFEKEKQGHRRFHDDGQQSAVSNQ